MWNNQQIFFQHETDESLYEEKLNVGKAENWKDYGTGTKQFTLIFFVVNIKNTYYTLNMSASSFST